MYNKCHNGKSKSLYKGFSL